MATKKHTLELTDLEMLALMAILDSFYTIEGIEDNGISQKDMKKIDLMLKKNGYKRQFN